MKQSLQTYLPEIHEPTYFNSFITSSFENSLKLIATNKKILSLNLFLNFRVPEIH